LFVIYLRSSSIGDFLSCEHKYFLGYTLGIQLDSNISAKKGSVLHKSMELLAKKKLSAQNKQNGFEDKETNTKFKVKDLNSYSAIEFAINHYKEEYKLSDWDIKEIKNWFWDTIKFNNGEYNPLNRKIIDVEHFFNFEIFEPWAYYSYILKDEPHVGRLVLRGTMDLLTEIDSKTLHYIDWKTGSRVDWKKFENGKPVEKTLEMIKVDPQLQLYHYVIRKKFPVYDNIIMTLFFNKSGGPFSVKFTKEDYIEHEKFIKKTFENIKSIQIPKLIKDEPTKNPHCKFCQFNKNKINEESYCSFYENEIIEKGLDKVTDEVILLDKHSQYEGGGSTRILTGD